MSPQRKRIGRLIAAELGECCAADVDARLETLDEYDAETPASAAGDLDALQTLGDETRHRIVRLLLTADGPLCVCEISHLVDGTDSAISHALSDLYDAGLVTREKDEQWRYYEPSGRAEALIEAVDRTREAGA